MKEIPRDPLDFAEQDDERIAMYEQGKPLSDLIFWKWTIPYIAVLLLILWGLTWLSGSH